MTFYILYCLNIGSDCWFHKVKKWSDTAPLRRQKDVGVLLKLSDCLTNCSEEAYWQLNSASSHLCDKPDGPNFLRPAISKYIK